MTGVRRRNGRAVGRLVHIVAHPDQKLDRCATACNKPRSRRYVGGHNWTRRKVNCRACLLALVDALNFRDFLGHIH